MKRVYGSYLSASDARRAINELLEHNYTREDIKVVSNKDLGEDLDFTDQENENDDRSLWEKIKDAFTFDEYDDNYWERNLDKDERVALEGYKRNLKAGEIIVLLEEATGKRAGKFYEGDTEFEKHFRDGVPDWDEREEEFNEGSGDEDLRGMTVKEDLHAGERRQDEDLRDKYPEDYHEREMNRANLGKNNLNPDNAGSVDVNKNTSDKYGNKDIDSPRTDESSINNMDRDPLRNDNLNDDGLRSDDLKDLDRAELERDDKEREERAREKITADESEISQVDDEVLEDLEAEKLEEQKRKNIQDGNPML